LEVSPTGHNQRRNIKAPASAVSVRLGFTKSAHTLRWSPVKEKALGEKDSSNNRGTSNLVKKKKKRGSVNK